MNDMLQITRAEFQLLLIVSVSAGQFFALAYSHHQWSFGTLLTLGSAVAAIVTIELRMRHRSAGRQSDCGQAPQKG